MNDLRIEFEEEALPFLDNLYRNAMRLTRNPDDAADLVQETCLRAYRTFDHFTPGTNCKAWLFTIMYSVFVNRYRQARRRPVHVSVEELEEQMHHALADAPDDAGGGFLARVETNWKEPEVDEALGRLSDEFRDAVLLVDVEGLSYDEAAGVLGCPIGTVRSRLYRGRKELFVALHDYARARGYLRRTEKQA